MQYVEPLPRSNLTRPSALKFAGKQALAYMNAESKRDKKKRVVTELRAVGVSRYGLKYSEMQELPNIIHANEHIQGAVYGHNEEGFAILIATDLRVLFIDKKPFFMKSIEINYDLIGGASYGRAGIFATVTLHTRIGDYKLKTMNFISSQRFLEFIEMRCLERKYNENAPVKSVWRV